MATGRKRALASIVVEISHTAKSLAFHMLDTTKERSCFLVI